MEDSLVSNGKELFGRIGHFGGFSKVIFLFFLIEQKFNWEVGAEGIFHACIIGKQIGRGDSGIFHVKVVNLVKRATRGNADIGDV